MNQQQQQQQHRHHHDKQPVTLADICWLKAHEEVVGQERVEALKRATLQWNAYKQPLLVDKVSGAILDGHHRYAVGCQLGLSRLPVVLVDYLSDENITVDTWPDSGFDIITKKQVVEMSLSDHVFPPKTSRHALIATSSNTRLPSICMPLSHLW